MVSGNVQGSVVGFNNPGNIFDGTQVELVGVGTSMIDGNNQFGFENVPAGLQQLEFTGGSHLARRVDINVSASGVDHFDDIDLVESQSFDVEAFDEIYREFQVEGTVRWNTRPERVMLDKASLEALPQGLAFFEDEVRKAYNSWLPNNTDGFFAGTPVNVGGIGSIDPDQFDCSDVPVGEIHIVGVDECPIDETFIILGSATHCFSTVNNEVVLAAIFFNPCSTVATIQHEIIHTICAGHLESMPNGSIMGSPGGAEEILALDRRHMRYLYTRPAGTMSPDDSWGLGALNPN